MMAGTSNKNGGGLSCDLGGESGTPTSTTGLWGAPSGTAGEHSTLVDPKQMEDMAWYTFVGKVRRVRGFHSEAGMGLSKVPPLQ